MNYAHAIKEQVIPTGVITENFFSDMATNGERLYLIWHTDSGLYYTFNSLKNNFNWIAPEQLSVPPSSPLNNGSPRLIFIQKRCILFYGANIQSLLGDVTETGKIQWHSLSIPILQRYEYAAQFNVTQTDDSIILSFAKSSGSLDVLVGLPWDSGFQRKTLVAPLQGTRIDPVARPSIVVNGNEIHLLWALCKKRTKGTHIHFASSIYHFYSPDFGKTWTRQKIDTGNTGREAIITNLKIIRSKDQLWILYIANGKLFMKSSSVTNSTSWTSPISITSHMPTLVKGVSGSNPLVLWVDPRFRGQEWWGKIPFHQVFKPNDTPDWKNNDVFMINLKSPIGTEQRITPALSYTDGLCAVILNDVLYVLRTGRSKAGYSLDQFGARPELFINKIPINN
ncbi:hypothetical protein GMMP1_130023 [Candidatus Magnetomoraceae bacterium gMMP-1]